MLQQRMQLAEMQPKMLQRNSEEQYAKIQEQQAKQEELLDQRACEST